MPSPAVASTVRILFSVVRIALAAYAGLALYMYLFQSRYVFYPSRMLHGHPSDIGLAYEDLELPVDDVFVHAWAVPAIAESAKWVLVCHGNAGNISHRLDTIRVFHDMGFGVLIFDYRGYGRSPGRPSERKSYEDAMSAWNWLTRERGVAPENVVIFGRSMGGAVAAWLAAETRPGALVVESAFTSIPDMGSRLYPYLPTRWLTRIHYPTVDLVGRVNCPVLVLHSSQDSLVPVEFGRCIHEAASPPKAFVELRGDHNGTMIDPTYSYEETLAEGLRRIGVLAPRPGSKGM